MPARAPTALELKRPETVSNSSSEIDPRSVATAASEIEDVIFDGDMISLCSLALLVDATAISASSTTTTTAVTSGTHTDCRAAAAALAWARPVPTL